MVNYFLDRLNSSGNLAGVNWTFTNGSTAVNCAGGGGNANVVLAATDYVKPNGKNEWYKVASVTDANNFVLSYAFAQANTADTCNYSDVSVNTGLTVLTAWVHPNRYTADTTRTAGDTLYCRRNQTHLIEGVNLNVAVTVGNATNKITVMADDDTGWAGESGPVTFDFNASTKGAVTIKNWWQYKNLVFHDSKGTDGMFNLSSTAGWSYFEGCTFDTANSTYGALNQAGAVNIVIKDCVFTSCIGGGGLYVGNPAFGTKVYNTTFDGCTKGFNATNNYCSNFYFEDCNFGVSSINATSDVDATRIASAVFRNCRLSSTTPIGNRTSMQYDSSAKFIDMDNTKNKNITYYGEGTVTRVTTPVRDGGADTSLQCEPTAKADDDSKFPFVCYETWIYNAAESKTYTVYVYADGTWSALPTAAQLYLEVSYFDAAGDSGRTTVVSDETIAGEEAWTALNVTCNPAAAGPVHLSVYLTLYEASKYIYIDPKVVIA